MYTILITINFSTIINSCFILYLWNRLYNADNVLRLPIADVMPSAPILPEVYPQLKGL